MVAKQRTPAAIGLAGKGGKKGGAARGEGRGGEGGKEGRPSPRGPAHTQKTQRERQKTGFGTGAKSGNGSPGDARESTPANSRLSTSKQALHIRLKRLKNAKDESEIRRLTDELQRIVFHKQYRNAEN